MSILDGGRAAAEARMASRVNVRRLTGDVVLVDGYEVPEWVHVYMGLPFRLGASTSGDGGARGVTVGGVTFSDATGVGSLPVSAVDLDDGDLLEVTSGEWSGSVFRVVEATKKDQATARRVPVVEVQRPEEWP